MARHPQEPNFEIPEAPEKVLSRRILVLINREMTDKVPRVIWGHEKPILEAMHGEGNVVDVDSATMDEGYTAKASPDILIHNKKQDLIKPPSETVGVGHVFIGSPAAEYQRLADAYGKHPEENVLLVEKIYGRFQEGRFARIMGTPALTDLPELQLRNLIIGYGYLPEAAANAPDAEKQRVDAAVKKFRAMDMAQLLKVAEDIGIEIG